MEKPKTSVLASYANPLGTVDTSKAKITHVTDDCVTAVLGRTTYTFYGCAPGHLVGDMVDVPIQCRRWSIASKWSPFDIPSEFDIDDE